LKRGINIRKTHNYKAKERTIRLFTGTAGTYESIWAKWTNVHFLCCRSIGRLECSWWWLLGLEIGKLSTLSFNVWRMPIGDGWLSHWVAFEP